MATATQQTPPPFYNVLPKNRAGGSLVNAGNGVSAGGLAENLSVGSETIFTPKFITVLVGGLVVLLALGYITYSLISKKPAESPVVEESNQQNQTEQPEPQPSEQTPITSQPPGVTTTETWQQQYFNNQYCQDATVCGDDADPDRDGLTNIREFQLQTDPNNNDSDNDQIADGDETLIFNLDPLKFRTANDPLYSDADYIKGGYDSGSGQLYTTEQLTAIKQRIGQYSLHQPTIGMLGDLAAKLYGFGDPTQLQSRGTIAPLPSSVTNTPEAKLDRDVQRQSTIKKIGSSLIKYKADKGSFPNTTEFQEMYNSVKAYNTVATNPSDPINQVPYIYSYESVNNGQDFILSYLSETQNQVIKYRAQDAARDGSLQSAADNDDRRVTDLDTIRSALLIYSSANVAGGKQYIFPTQNDYKTALVPKYVTAIPKDPVTNQDYEYQVSATFDSFTLKTKLENPSAGSTGYQCNQDECSNY